MTVLIGHSAHALLSLSLRGLLCAAAASAAAAGVAFAQEPADPEQCVFNAAKYAPTGGALVHSKRYHSRSGSFAFQKSFGANIRARLKFDLAAGSSEAWTFRLISEDNSCANAIEFKVDQAMIARRGANLLSPVMCGRLRLEWAVTDFGEPPPVELTVYRLDVPYQQLGIYDSQSRLNGPKWCEVADFESAGGAPPRKFYAPNRAGFSSAVSSAVFIGWEKIDPELQSTGPGGPMAFQPEYTLQSCSGFFIAPSLVMTNRHCVCPSGEWSGRACPGDRGEPAFDGAESFAALPEGRRIEARDWRIWSRAAAGADGRNGAPSFQRAEPVILGALRSEEARPEPVAAPPWPLDYAVLRIDPRESDGAPIRPARLVLDEIDAGDLLIAHYPGNYPFAVSYDSDCRVVAAERLPMKAYESVFVGHGCDTHGGSSGSPVFRRDLSGVVGVHYCCTKSTDSAAFKLLSEDGASPEDLKRDHPELAGAATIANEFAPIRRIVCDIKRRDAGLFDEIARGQAWTAADRSRINAVCAAI